MSIPNQMVDKRSDYVLLPRLLAQTSMTIQDHQPRKRVGSRDVNAGNLRKEIAAAAY